MHFGENEKADCEGIAWTDRHDGFQRAVQRAMWFTRLATRAVGTHSYVVHLCEPHKIS